MSSSTFIPKHERQKLDEELERVPWLVEQLGIAFLKQDNLGARTRIRRVKRPSEHPLPYNEHAADLLDEMHNELGTWVRLVCEQRAVRFMPVKFTHDHTFIGPLQATERRMPYGYTATTADLSRWLRRNLMSVALTEGAQEALTAIGGVVDRAQCIATPYRRDNTVDARRLESANEELLSASSIATIAGDLDERYRNLTKRRVHHLHASGKINPSACHAYSDPSKPTHLFRLGDVLQQHLLVPIRRRHAVAA